MAFVLPASFSVVGLVTATAALLWRVPVRDHIPVVRSTGYATRPSAAPGVVVAAAGQLSVAEQWERLSGILNGASAAVEAAGRLQANATQKLDLADYGLTTLVDELSTVMTLPGRKSRFANLHVLSTATSTAVAAGDDWRKAANHALAA